MYLIDCGEGAQMQLARYRTGFRHLNALFISHMHGDHVFGLPGLISSLGLMGRTAALNVIGPEALGDFLNYITERFCGEMNYSVNFIPADTEQSRKVYEDRTAEVYCVPLHHRIPCCGYLFREKAKKPHIIREMTDFYDIPYYAFNDIKDGVPWTTEDGEEIPASRLTRPADPVRSYAYISDTAPVPEIYESIKGVDLLYHEATFGSDNEARAEMTVHSTASQAAQAAVKCGAKKLIIGHFSSRYKDESVLLAEAQRIFPSTFLAAEGKIFKIQ